MLAANPAAAFAAAGRQPVVLDARLLLRPMGLSLAMAMSETCQAWLAREFLSLINPQLDDVVPPRCAGPHDGGREEADSFSEAVEMWRAAYANGVVHSAFQWIGDTPAESPGRSAAKPGIVSCFDALLQTLNPGFDLGWPPLMTCGMQSLALAASLAPVIPVLLTSAARGDEPPALCRDAEEMGLAQSRLPDVSGFGGALIPGAASALELAGLMGTSVAAVWLAAPRANLLNNLDALGDYVPQRYRLTAAECLPWKDARVFWKNVSDDPRS